MPEVTNGSGYNFTILADSYSGVSETNAYVLGKGVYLSGGGGDLVSSSDGGSTWFTNAYQGLAYKLTIDGVEEYAQTTVNDWGGYVGDVFDYEMGDADYGHGAFFSAPASGNLETISIYYTGETGGGPGTCTLTLRTGTTAGSGTELASVQFTPVDGWNEISLSVAFAATGLTGSRDFIRATSLAGVDAVRDIARHFASEPGIIRSHRAPFCACGVDQKRDALRMVLSGIEPNRATIRQQGTVLSPQRDHRVYWGESEIDGTRSAARHFSAGNTADRSHVRTVSIAAEPKRDHERLQATGVKSRRREFTESGWKVYAVNISTGAETYLGFVSTDDSPKQLTGVSLPNDATYRIEARPSGVFWPECRTRESYLLRLASDGSTAETSGLPGVEGLTASISHGRTRITWRATESLGRTADHWGVWYSPTSPVDTSGDPDTEVQYIADREAYILHSQTASEYVAVAAIDASGDTGESSELSLPWDSTAPARPQGQRV